MRDRYKWVRNIVGVYCKHYFRNMKLLYCLKVTKMTKIADVVKVRRLCADKSLAFTPGSSHNNISKLTLISNLATSFQLYLYHYIIKSFSTPFPENSHYEISVLNHVMTYINGIQSNLVKRLQYLQHFRIISN